MTYESALVLGNIAGGGNTNEAYHINSDGYICGRALNAASNIVPCVWIPSSYTGAPTQLSLSGVVGASGGQANDVSEDGRYCGIISFTGGGSSGGGFRWDTIASIPTFLTPIVGKSFSNAWGINASNQVAGYSYSTGSFNSRPTLWNNSTTATDLDFTGYIGGNAYQISESGIIVGVVVDASSHSWGAWWDAAIPGTLNVLTPPTFNSLIQGVNVDGEFALYRIGTQAYFYDGTLQALTGGTFAQDVSDTGVVCGVLGGTHTSALVWADPAGAAETLTHAIATPDDVWADGISNDGRNIVGHVTTLSFSSRAVLWERVPVVATDVISTIATIDHDLLIGVEPDQHHTEVHALAGPDHLAGLYYKSGVSPDISDADFISPVDGMAAVTFDTSSGLRLMWVRSQGIWTAVET